MMKTDEEIIESLIADGLISAPMIALLSKNQDEGETLGTLAGAALLATFKANQKAMLTKLPMYVEEAGNLYQTQPNGTKKFIRKLEKPTRKLEENFKLK